MKLSGDQATGLRSLLGKASVRVALFVSGVRRAGKTTAVANLALAGAQRGKNVMLIDESRNSANTVAQCCGVSGRYDLLDAVTGSRSMEEVLVHGPDGVTILPVGRAVKADEEAVYSRPWELAHTFERLADQLDWLLIDATSGFDTRLLPLALSANEIIVVMPEDGNGLTGSYAMMKLLRHEFEMSCFRVLATRTRNQNAVQTRFDRLRRVAARHLGARVDLLGNVPFDGTVKRASALARPLISSYPNACATRAFRGCVESLLDAATTEARSDPAGILLKRLFDGSQVDFAAAIA